MQVREKLNVFHKSVDSIQHKVDPTKTISSKFNVIKKHGKISDLVRKIISAFMFGSSHIEQTTDKALFKQVTKLIKKCSPEELQQLKEIMGTYQKYLVVDVQHKNVAEDAARVARHEAPVGNVIPENIKKMFDAVFVKIDKQQNAQVKPAKPEQPEGPKSSDETPPTQQEETPVEPEGTPQSEAEKTPPQKQSSTPPEQVTEPEAPPAEPEAPPAEQAVPTKVVLENGDILEDLPPPPSDDYNEDESTVPQFVNKTPLQPNVEAKKKLYES
ncbi:MAG: hypothetical protein CK425_10155 [Parachlamydia sp.]|nr:MAG: hypothetical protein CK425_10155 [Parachlamydia sp.]